MFDSSKNKKLRKKNFREIIVGSNKKKSCVIFGPDFVGQEKSVVYRVFRVVHTLHHANTFGWQIISGHANAVFIYTRCDCSVFALNSIPS